MMLRNYASMSNLKYHEKQITYNLTNLLNEVKFQFPDDEKIDLSNPKYQELLSNNPFNPKLMGGLAESLQIKDKVLTVELWEDLANGWCPVDEKSPMFEQAIETPRGKMVQFNQTATQISPLGTYEYKKDSTRRCGTEFIFPFGERLSSAISLMATTDPTVEGKFADIAVKIFNDRVMPEMLKLARVRKGKQGAIYEVGSEILAVPFMHSENRSEQAFYHFHFDLMNVARGQDGELNSLCTDEIGANASALDAIFMSGMKEELEKEFGFVFEAVKHQDDVENEFLDIGEMKTVSFDLPHSVIPSNVQEYRKARDKEMVEALKKTGKKGYEAEELARHASRDDKTEKSPAELRAKWKDDYNQLGWTVEQFHKDLEKAKIQKANEVLVPPTDSVLEDSFLRNHKDVAFTEYQYMAHIHKQLLPYMSSEQAQREATRIFESTCQLAMSKEQMEYFKPFLDGKIEDPTEHQSMQLKFMREAKFLHNSTIARDKYISESLLARKDETLFAYDKAEVSDFITKYEEKQPDYNGKAFKFGKGQREAIMMIGSENGAVCNVAGRAGAGKSTLLKVAREFYKERGFHIYGTSTSSTATKGLAESTGMGKDDFYNTTKLVKLLEEGKLKFTPRTILFWDEAGMADSKTFYEIIQHINKAGAKVVLVGEKEQLTPVGAGGSFKRLNEEHITTKVTEINRQNDQWQREMVEDFASGRSKDAIKSLHEKGRVAITKTEGERLEKIVNDFLTAKETNITGTIQFKLLDQDGNEHIINKSSLSFHTTAKNKEGVEYEINKSFSNEELLEMATSTDKKKFFTFKKALQQNVDFEIKEVLTVTDQLQREVKDIDFKQKVILSATNNDIDAINEKVRATLKAQGKLPTEEFTIQGKDGQERGFSVGDRIIFVKNQKGDDVDRQKFLNAEQGQIVGVVKSTTGEPKAIRLLMDDGRETMLDLNKKHNIKHSYATSIHKSQGSTKTESFYYVSGNTNSLHHAYVACSRHRKNMTMYLSEDMVGKLEKKMTHKEPTAQMKKVAEWVAQDKGLDLPSEVLASYTETRSWLSEHWKDMGTDQEKALDKFSSIIEAMAKENYKKTSHDYELLDGKVATTYASIKAQQLEAIKQYRKKPEEIPIAVKAKLSAQNQMKQKNVMVQTVEKVVEKVVESVQTIKKKAHTLTLKVKQ